MQYWKKSNLGKVERLEEDVFKKHPEKIKWLKEEGYERVMGESDWSPYKEPKKSAAKKAVKKIKKKLKK
tara:strand:- start:141 stop:347 length:207 start_codon:yes stop_codon:yes gene_type:complete